MIPRLKLSNDPNKIKRFNSDDFNSDDKTTELHDMLTEILNGMDALKKKLEELERKI